MNARLLIYAQLGMNFTYNYVIEDISIPEKRQTYIALRHKPKYIPKVNPSKNLRRRQIG
jgi:hypothetical protein